jgi:hypothetical protein
VKQLWEFGRTISVKDGRKNDYKPSAAQKKSHSLSLEEFIKSHVLPIVQRRGRELPGGFDDMKVAELFRFMSRGWKSISEDHINKVSDACREFLRCVLLHVAPEEVIQRHENYFLNDAMDARRRNAELEVKKLDEDRRSHPITLNPNYLKRRKAIAMVAGSAPEAKEPAPPGYGTIAHSFGTHLVNTEDAAAIFAGVDHQCKQLLEDTLAYYEVHLQAI